MTISTHTNWNYPTAVRFGPGRIRELADACEGVGIKRPLLVTDSGLARLPLLDVVREAASAQGASVGVFSRIEANPTGEQVEDGTEAFRVGRHDGVIALGGGSALDAAKAIALMVGQQRPLWDFEDVGDNWTRVDASGVAPVVAVPTTSGTGSEVGRASVITDTASHSKKIIFHPKMLPPVVIADPELTLGLPAHLTATVGMDALSHNLEALCAPGNHPMADGIAMEGIRLVAENIKVAVADPTNIEARSGMMIASLMGATAFQKGLGAMHSMAHVVGGQLNAHHGETIAVVMPYVLRANEKAVGDRLSRLARHIDLPSATFAAFVDWVLDLRDSFSIPDTLSRVGMQERHIEAFAAAAVLDPSTGTNPIPFNADDFSRLFSETLSGFGG